MRSSNMDVHIQEDDVDENMSNSSIVHKQPNFQTTATLKEEQQNIVFKLLNRQNTGYFTNSQQKRSHENAFKEIPRQLSFCLKDIVPYCYLEGHVFMGLTACGQFLISYKMSIEYDETMTSDFFTAYKYELYFWIYRPHCLLSKYYYVCLFDDHGVDDCKTVSMTQWSTDNQTLIVHGASEIDEKDNYITIMRVPKLGCLECKQMRDDDVDGNNRQDILCIKCNLTIHTKYRNTDSGPKFNPKYNFNCPGYIIMSENSFIHSINIQLNMNKDKNIGTNTINYKYVNNSDNSNLNNCDITNNKKCLSNATTTINSTAAANKNRWHDSKVPIVAPSPTTSTSINLNKAKMSAVEEIIADFSEYDVDTNTVASPSSYFQRLDRNLINTKPASNFNELVITYGHSASSSQHNSADEANVNLLDHKKNINYDLISDKPSSSAKSVPTGTTTITTPHTIKLKNTYQLTDSITPLINNSSTVPNNNVITNNSNSKCTKSYDQFEFTEDTNPKNDIKVEQQAAANAYEFSEDNEKCEKISTFRKRRLADKKYEFSEDNTENIVPFNRIRNRVRSRIQQQQSPSNPYHHYSYRSPSLSPSHNSLFNPSPPNYEVTSHLHRASPSHGFRSACGSPVSNRLRSPPGIRSPNYHQRSPSSNNIYHTKSLSNYCFMSSPKSLIKQNNIQVFSSFAQHQLTPSSSSSTAFILPNSPLNSDDIPSFLMDSFQKAEGIKMNGHHYIMERNTASSISNDAAVVVEEQSTERPACSKKIIKRFVEEDDANSVVTNEEDDCISPGYHASLPIEVHGSCYSPMQLISTTSILKVKCPTVTIIQHSFDMETFTFYVANHLCCEKNKKYGILLDSAYELIHVCPLTEILSCILVMQFTANDKENIINCINCSNTVDCIIHRRLYESRTLFYWNINTGEWHVIDYGNLLLLSDYKNNNNRCNEGSKKKKKHGRGSSNSDIINNMNSSLNNGKKKNLLKDELIRYTKKLFRKKSRTYDYLQHLRVLDSNIEKTKKTLKDFKNMIEFYRRHANDPSSSSSDSDMDDDMTSIYDEPRSTMYMSLNSSDDNFSDSSVSTSSSETEVLSDAGENNGTDNDDDENDADDEDVDGDADIDNATIRSSNPCLRNIL